MEPQTGLNTLDCVVLGVVAVSGLFALFRGFIREVFSLAALVIGVFAAMHYYPLAEPTIHHYIRSKEAAPIAAGFAIFCLVYLIITIIGMLVVRLVRGDALTAIDRSLGFAFGIVRGAVIVCVIYFSAAQMFWPEIDDPEKVKTEGVETMPEQRAENGKKDQTEDDKPYAPEWILKAKTRPFLAAGAATLQSFIPEKEIEKKTQQYLEQKAAAQKVIEQKALDLMSTPAPVVKEPGVPEYNDKARYNLDKLIDEKVKP